MYRERFRCAFLFSGLPVKCTDTELLTKIKDALAFGDLTLLEEIRDKYPVGSTDWKRLEYIQRYIRMILILSMEKLAMNPGKEQIEYSFCGLYERNYNKFVRKSQMNN